MAARGVRSRGLQVLEVTGTIVVGLLATVAVVVLGLLLYVRTDSGRARLRTLALEQIRQSVPGFDVAHIGGNLTRRIVLDEVTIRDASGQAAVRVRRITAELNLLALLHGRLEIDGLSLDAPQIDGRVGPDGKLNLGELVVPPKKKSKPWPLEVRALRLAEGAIELVPQGGEPVHASELTAAANLTSDGDRLRFEVASLSGTVEIGERVIALETRVQGRLTAEHVDVSLGELSATGLVPDDAAIVLSGSAHGPREHVALALQAELPGHGSARVEGWAGVSQSGEPRFDLEAALDPADLRALGVRALPARIRLTMHARGQGTPLAPGSSGELSLDLHRFPLRGAAIGPVHLHATTQGTRWTLRAATARAQDLFLAARGHGEGQTLELAVDGKLGAGALAVLRAAGPKPPPVLKGAQGKVELHARVSGSMPSSLDMAASLHVRNAVAGDLHVGRADAELRASHLPQAPAGRAHVTVSDVELQGSAIGFADLSLDATRKGTRKAPAMAVEGLLQARNLAIATLRARALSLVVSGQGTKAPPGQLAVPRGQVRLLAFDVRAVRHQAPLDSLRLDVQSDGRSVRASGAGTGRRTKAVLEAHATLAPSELHAILDQLSWTSRGQEVALAGPAELRFRPGRSIELSPTRVRLFGGQIAASGAYHFRPDGERTPWLALEVTGTQVSAVPFEPIDGKLQVSARGRRLETRLDAQIGPSHTAVHLDAAIPVEPASGERPPSLARHGALSLHLATHDLRLEQIPTTLLLAHGVRRGLLTLSAEASGDIRDPTLRVQAQVREVAVGALESLAATLSVQSHDGETQLTATSAFSGKPLLDAQGRLRLGLRQVLATPAGAHARPLDLARIPVELAARIPGFDLAGLAAYLDAFEGVHGTARAQIAVRGTLGAPQGEAEIAVDGAQVDSTRFGRVALEAKLVPHGVRADVALAEQSGGSLEAHLEAGAAADAPLGARLRASHLPMGFARLLLPQVREIDGKLDADLQASGTRRAPALSGTLRLGQGRLGVVGQPTFGGVELAVALSPGHIALDKLELKSGGTLRAKGTIEVQALQPQAAHLEAQASDFLLSYNGISGAKLNGKVTVDAKTEAKVLQVALHVPKGNLWVPKIGGGRTLYSSARRPDVHFVDPLGQRESEHQNVSGRDLDLHGKIGTLYVRGKDVDLELGGNAHVEEDRGELVIRGTIDVRRGHIMVEKTAFHVDRAHIAWNGDPDLNPSIDIRLIHQYPDALVTVALSGTLKKPELKLSSDPPVYDQAQIVSLIISGSAGGPGTGGQGVDAAGAISTIVLGQLADKIAPQLGLDVFRVDQVQEQTDDGDLTGQTDTRVEVGKYVSDRIFLSYVHVFGASEHENTNEAHLEYRVTRRWMLETAFGDAGVGGLDALWKYRY